MHVLTAVLAPMYVLWKLLALLNKYREKKFESALGGLFFSS
jgi:hypothetical protein